MSNEKNEVRVSQEFKDATVELIIKKLKEKDVIYILREKDQRRVYKFIGADVSIEFYNFRQNKPQNFDIVICNEKISYYSSEAVKKMYDACDERLRELRKEENKSKEEDLTKKLMMEFSKGVEK